MKVVNKLWALLGLLFLNRTKLFLILFYFNDQSLKLWSILYHDWWSII